MACDAGPPELKVAPEVEFAVYVLLNFMSTKAPPCKFWGREHVVEDVPLFSFELACRLQAASPPVTMWCLAPPDSCFPPAVCCASARLTEATTSISGLFYYCYMMNCCYMDMLPLVATTLRGCAPPGGWMKLRMRELSDEPPDRLSAAWNLAVRLTVPVELVEANCCCS